jgi:hypothetical protein
LRLFRFHPFGFFGTVLRSIHTEFLDRWSANREEARSERERLKTAQSIEIHKPADFRWGARNCSTSAVIASMSAAIPLSNRKTLS